MEVFFDLFQSNPLLLFFVIAAVLSFFQGLGGNKKEDQRRTGNPNPQRESQNKGEVEIDWREIFRQENSPFEERTNEQQSTTLDHRKTSHRQVETARKTANKVEPSYVPASVESELEKVNRDLNKQYEKVKEKKRRALEGVFTQIKREDAINGIIWAEVLDKPKARRSR